MNAIIVTALSGFISAFLQRDITLLQNMGFKVHCAADDTNSNVNARDGLWDELGVTFHQIEFDSTNPMSKKTLSAYLKIRKLMEKEMFDVVHCHTPIAGFVTRLAVKSYHKKGVKVIYTTHGFYFHKKAPIRDWLKYYPLEKIASLWSDAIITINNEDLNCARHMWAKKCYKINSVGLDTKKYMSVSIDKDEYRKSLGVESEDVMVLAAGELSDRKNHSVVIKALGKLNNHRIVFVICGRATKGKGTYDSLLKLSKENGVRLKFLGFRYDMPMIYRCADICVLPSKREGLGMVGLQSLISGVPLVSSNVHGIKDYMIEGKTGYMYDPDDVNGFAEGIELLCDPDRRNIMVEYCVDMALKFSAEISTAQMEKIYREVLKEKV